MSDFVVVSEEHANQILSANDITPQHLVRDAEDHTFTATFSNTPTPIMREEIANAHPAIEIVKPEVINARVPNNEPALPIIVRFGFTQQPD